jgi:hypothetical protein
MLVEMFKQMLKEYEGKPHQVEMTVEPTPTPAPVNDALVDTKEAQRLLAGISNPTLQKLNRAGLIKKVKIGTKITWSLNSIQKYIENNMIMAWIATGFIGASFVVAGIVKACYVEVL